MKRICLIVLAVALMHAFVSAQQGGVNTSVLPARSNLQLPPGSVADEFLKTDLLAQKQVEGSIAASTRKPDRLFAVFNDYRGVNGVDFIFGEEGAPPTNFASAFIRWLFRRPAPDRDRPSVRAQGSAEAWAGGSISNDGGATWSGLFLPGSPFDTSQPPSALKKFGFEAATDPWIVAGPCGYFYVAL